MFRCRRNKTSQSNTAVPVVILSVFFGLAAGMVGMLIVLAYFPSIGPQIQWGSGTSMAPAIQIQAKHTAAEFAVRDIAASSALLFQAEDIGEFLLVTKAIGAGVVLTSDGWLLSHSSVLEAAHRPSGKGLMAVVGKNTYEVEKVIVDTFTGIAWLKVNGTSLPVASFGKSETLAIGDAVFAFDVTGGLREAGVIALGSLPAEEAAEIVRSSEKIQKVLRLSGAEGFASGTAVLNSAGESVGIFVGDSVVGTYAIPLDAFFRQVGDVLREGIVVRPYIGINFVDLSEYPTASGLNRGVKLRSVVKGGPAVLAGLREGDVIKAVNGEQVTTNKTLSEILVGYRPGEVISLTILRAETELEVEVTLAKMPIR